METIEQKQYRESVNKRLWRKIKPGQQYEGLIPNSLNIVHKFDKEEDYSNTFNTLEFMAQWTNKYAAQMSKIAPLLKGRTLKETCDNIYQFLYWHFQYALDGNVQDLHSPSSAWRNRQKGFDCKTYSILAGCILTNLQIPYSLRMVQLSNPIWSHVYVVVPNGNNHFVIDATTHNNKEVNFSNKYDKTMVHRGLANPISPYNKLGCACKGQPIALSGLGNPVVLQNAVANFHNFLNQLEKQGVSKNVTNTMLQLVRQSIESGINPNMSEVLQRSIEMNRMIGLGASIGENITNISGAFSGNPESIKNLVSTIIPPSFLANTFGAVFANGFDTSCWGASLTPQKAQTNLQKKYTPYFNYLLKNIETAQNASALQNAVNAFIRDAYAMNRYHLEYKPKEANWSNCAKKALKHYQDFSKIIKDKADALISEFVMKGATVSNAKMTPIKVMMSQAITGYKDVNDNETWKVPSNSFVDYPQLTLSALTIVNPNGNNTNLNISGNVVDNGNGTITYTNPATGQSQVLTTEQAVAQGIVKPTTGNITPTTNKDSLTLPLLGVGGAIAAFMLFSPKGDVTKSKSSTKKK